MNRLDRLDQRLFGVERSKRRLRQPAHPDALAAWERLSPQIQERARESAVFARVEDHPVGALIVADFQDQMVATGMNFIAWYWAAVVAVGVILTVLATAVGIYAPVAAFAGLAIPGVTGMFSLRRLDRARRSNLAIAHGPAACLGSNGQ